MGAENLSCMRSIETHARTFLPLNISAISSVAPASVKLSVETSQWRQIAQQRCQPHYNASTVEMQPHALDFSLVVIINFLNLNMTFKRFSHIVLSLGLPSFFFFSFLWMSSEFWWEYLEAYYWWWDWFYIRINSTHVLLIISELCKLWGQATFASFQVTYFTVGQLPFDKILS